jgi:hypothetical protein
MSQKSVTHVSLIAGDLKVEANNVWTAGDLRVEAYMEVTWKGRTHRFGIRACYFGEQIVEMLHLEGRNWRLKYNGIPVDKKNWTLGDTASSFKARTRRFRQWRLMGKRSRLLERLA